MFNTVVCNVRQQGVALLQKNARKLWLLSAIRDEVLRLNHHANAKSCAR